MRGFVDRFDAPFPTYIFLFFVFLLKVRSALAYQFYSLAQNQSTVVQEAEMTVDKHSVTSGM